MYRCGVRGLQDVLLGENHNSTQDLIIIIIIFIIGLCRDGIEIHISSFLI